jgi:hypothetical protein
MSHVVASEALSNAFAALGTAMILFRAAISHRLFKENA